MLKTLWVAGALALAMTSPAFAQDMSVDEIVVTGSRAREWDPEQLPHVQLVRRADNLIVSIRVVGDTRDAGLRRTEMVTTLRGIARAAAGRTDIDISLENEGVLVPLTEDMVSTLTMGVDGNRADTSVVSIIVKTPIGPNDSLDSASGRIESFVTGVPKSGRTLVSIWGDWQLTVINPNQYRAAILALMSADATTTSTAFGPQYAVQVQGLQYPVTWRQSGPLELALFIPYSLTVTPRP
ncbi:MAG: hypothetical protein V4707_05140 [Pseudomonadota bacterium]